MKLLMITRRIDRSDGLAGFTYQWVTWFAEMVDELFVICLEKVDSEGLPRNCRVVSLGKEKGKNRLRELWNFMKYAWQLVPKVDGVFSHQNPEYGILIAPWCWWYKKRLIAWYTHGSVTWKTRLLEKVAHTVVTASRESFRLPSKKVRILHHGIDTRLFAYEPKRRDSNLTLLSISRISPTKNIQLMIDLLGELRKQSYPRIQLLIAGSARLQHEKEYEGMLHKHIASQHLDVDVTFLGEVPNFKTPDLYHRADIFLNFSDTGSMDKTVLEAMSSGTLVLVTNDAFQEALANIDTRLYAKKDLQELVAKAQSLAQDPERGSIVRKEREYVVAEHGLDDLLKRVVALYA